LKTLQKKFHSFSALAKNVLYSKTKSNNSAALVENNLTVWDTRLNPENDLFLASYPRSGNTWLRYLMTNLRFPDARWNLQSLACAFPEIYSSVDPFSVPFPRWIKTHHTYKPSYPKIIYLIRDGRDVAVSFYHWSDPNRIEPFEKFLKRRILAKEINPTPWGEWHSHVIGYLDQPKSSDMLIVHYEALVDSPVSELQRISEFVGLRRSKEAIEIAIERSSFNVQQSDFQDYQPFKNKRVGVGGVPGKWVEFFTDELHDYFWRVAGDAMNRAGYERSK